MGSIFGLIILVLDIIAIVGVLKSSMGTGKMTLWIILIIIMPVVGVMLYFFNWQEELVFRNRVHVNIKR
ncbi:MAG: hypothetical protein A2539_08815 [Elusimicrobia bacterium RIFOXYD2_FULL_34_15]|nr:MAG: hypothetical protein A2539_08815 [Elusimicrobia bacterium RIFOXYD2_FULL_34_15]